MLPSVKHLVAVAFFGLIYASSVIAYSDYDDGRYNLYRDDDTVSFLPGGLRSVAKRIYPRWHHDFVFRDPTFRTSAIAESKRFLPPFHPLARFRGISMHGGGIPSAYRPRVDYESLASSLPIQPNPSHPVPSDPKIRVSESEEQDLPVSEEEPEPQQKKMTAGDILRYLSQLSGGVQGNTNSRARVFRFGIK